MIIDRARLAALGHNQQGSVALIFAVCILGIVGSTALAIDLGRAYGVQTKVRAALDAAALAGAKLLNETSISNSEVEERTRTFFQAQLDTMGIKGASITNFQAVPNRTESTVRTSVNVNIATTFAKTIGMPAVTMAPSAEVTFKMKKIELALVLDVTGSMAGSKLDALKQAATELVNTLKASAIYSGAIKVSIVPYAAAVNVGSYAWAASGGASTDDCVVERSGGGAFTNEGPGPGHYVDTATTATYPYYSCPMSRIAPLADIATTDGYSQTLSAISALTANGATAGHIGLAWGWYTVSPEWNGVWDGFNSARPYAPKEVIKAVILMTDGAFNSAYKNAGATGEEGDNSIDPAKPGSSAYQALKICENMRNPAEASKAVKIYTVAFEAPTTAETVLKQCGGESNAYVADNAAELNKSFAAIAEKLTKLSVSK